MDNQNLGRISIDSANRPRQRFNLRHDVNTSASFGDCQPVLCRQCIAGTKSVLSVDTLVRLAPMVAPTRSRVGVRLLSKFVGMSELTENYPAFVAQQKITRGALSFVPQALPHIALGKLSAMALVGARFTLYRFSSSGVQDDSSDVADVTLQKFTTDVIDPNLSNWNSSMRNSWSIIGNTGVLTRVNADANDFYSMGGKPNESLAWDVPNTSPFVNVGRLLGWSYDFFVPCANEFAESFFAWRGEEISLEEADFVIPAVMLGNNESGVNEQHAFFFAVKLSAFGSRIRKALIGCGYQLDLLSDREVSLIPLFAYYKAYYDSFGLMLYENWENNPVTRMLRYYDDNNQDDFGTWLATAPIAPAMSLYFIEFIRRLGLAFYSEEQDFVSCHIRDLSVSPDPLGAIPAVIPNSPAGVRDVASGDSQSEPAVVSGSSGQSHLIAGQNYSQLDLELLRKAYQVTNRNTIAGKRIAEILRANGQGKYVDECKSTFVGESYVPIDVTDVNATADATSSVTGQTSVLGDYTGKGVGYEESKTFVYENEEYGFLVTIAVVIPESGYTQQMDAQCLVIHKEDGYNSDFDGMGFEANQKRLVCGQVDWPDGNFPDALDATFGFAPRYTRHKVCPNKVNGNFSKRSARTSFLPYTLDKFIAVGEREVEQTSDTSGGTTFRVQKAFSPDKFPCATPNLRFVGRFPWLGFLNRIFNNFGKPVTAFEYHGVQYDSDSGAPRLWEYTNGWDDNFMLFNFVNLVQFAPMLAIEDSFETREDGNKGKTDVSVGKA